MLRDAIILAGGKGSRLKEVVRDIPKPMAAINDKPFLSYLMDFLKRFGIGHVVMAVGYRHEVITGFYGDRYEGMDISYSIESTPLGTGGGISQAFEKVAGEMAFVLNGDSFYDCDLAEFYEFHRQKAATLSLALNYMEDFERYGIVNIDPDNRILGFKEKQYQESGYINAGVYIMPRSTLTDPSLPEVFSLEKDILESGKVDGIYGFPGRSYFIDIGIPEDYERAQHELQQYFH